MPGYRGHLVGGAVFYTIALYILLFYVQPPPFTILEWLLCSLAGSLFPDVDIKSKGQKLFYRAMMPLLIFLLLQKHFAIMGLLSIVAMTPMIVKHRGIFHKLWFVIGLPAGIALFASFYFPEYANTIAYDTFFFIVGAISHLWLDLGFWKMIRL